MDTCNVNEETLETEKAKNCQRRKKDQILVLLDDGNGYHNGNISSIPLPLFSFSALHEI